MDHYTARKQFGIQRAQSSIRNMQKRIDKIAQRDIEHKNKMAVKRQEHRVELNAQRKVIAIILSIFFVSFVGLTLVSVPFHILVLITIVFIVAGLQIINKVSMEAVKKWQFGYELTGDPYHDQR